MTKGLQFPAVCGIIIKKQERVSTMRVVGKFCIREILDEIVAIPMESGSEHFSGIVSLNPVGQFLFELLAEEQTEEALITALTAEYEVDEATAAADVREFLGILRENKLLSE